jgi:hypothetical protein
MSFKFLQLLFFSVLVFFFVSSFHNFFLLLLLVSINKTILRHIRTSLKDRMAYICLRVEGEKTVRGNILGFNVSGY